MYTKSLNKLIEEFTRLPGVGPKSAERMALYVLKGSLENAKSFALALVQAKQSLNYCKICNNLSETQACNICQDSGRDKDTICVVEEPKDVVAIERSGAYHGVYHVLLGAISPLDDIKPEDLKIRELIMRIRQNSIKEIIIATNSNAEGETTALYLAKLMKSLKIKATRIACGIPAGGNLEYADQATLDRALRGRQII